MSRRRASERPPRSVVALLPTGESVLAAACAADGTWVLGTRSHLLLAGPGPARLVPWERVEDAQWDVEGSRLRVTEVAEYGSARPVHDLELEEPPRLLQLVRERVTASIVLERRSIVAGRRGVTVIGRRNPAGGPLAWMHAYDPGLDPDDPAVRSVADRALREARSEVGDLI